jgi:hypothetical protein
MWRFIMIIAGGVLLYFGVKEWRMAAQASAAPQEISLRDLIARGGDGNPHVMLKDFHFGNNPVYFYRNTQDCWSDVWIPVIPSAAPGNALQPAAPTAVQAIVMSKRVKSEAELDRFCEQTTVQAWVTDIWLDGDREIKLRQSYPGTDFSRCLIIEEGRAPAGPVRVGAFLGGGAVLLGLGVLRLMNSLRQPRAESPTDQVPDDGNPNA